MTDAKQSIVNINQRLRTSYMLMLASIFAGAFLYGPAFSSMPLGEWIASCLVVGFFVALPLMMFIPVALRPRASGVSWMSFLLLAYLIYGIVLIFSADGLLAGLMLTGTTLSTFIYVIAWLRPLKKAAKARKKAEQREAG
jgi:uncharacterized membrane protein